MTKWTQKVGKELKRYAKWVEKHIGTVYHDAVKFETHVVDTVGSTVKDVASNPSIYILAAAGIAVFVLMKR